MLIATADRESMRSTSSPAIGHITDELIGNTINTATIFMKAREYMKNFMNIMLKAALI